MSQTLTLLALLKTKIIPTLWTLHPCRIIIKSPYNFSTSPRKSSNPTKHWPVVQIGQLSPNRPNLPVFHFARSAGWIGNYALFRADQGMESIPLDARHGKESTDRRMESSAESGRRTEVRTYRPGGARGELKKELEWMEWIGMNRAMKYLLN